MFKWLGKLFSATHMDLHQSGYATIVRAREKEKAKAEHDREQGIDPTRTGNGILGDELILTDQDVARVLRVPVAKITGLAETDLLPGILIYGELRFRSRDVQAFVNSLIRPA